MRPLCILIFILFSNYGFSQKKEKLWNSATIENANTAKNENYMTDEEKEVIFYLNLVRLEPKLFSETFLKRYLDSSKTQNSYSRSLKKTLEKTASMDALIPQKKLFQIAKPHAIKFGKEGKTGHADFPQRIKNVASNYSGYMGENCDYGEHSALQIVMELLIDDGIKDLGHRENILNPKYHYVGVSIQPHKRYVSSCVIDFGG
jgi:hypothetical protein